MSASQRNDRSVPQKVANEGKSRRLPRADALTAYVMDRLLYRLGHSLYAGEFYLKGGVLIANLIDAPHRHTRDIDLLRGHGACDVDAHREIFRKIVAVDAGDGLHFDPRSVRARLAERARDDYDGVKVSLTATVGGSEVEVSVDIGFGDALVLPTRVIELQPFLAESPRPRVHAYPTESVLAEKIETIVGKFPAIRHRLKDILDVVTLAANEAFDGGPIVHSLGATMERRATAPDPRVLDDMRDELRSKTWLRDWATMCKDKRVAQPMALHEAVERFAVFVRAPLAAIGGIRQLGRWPAGGPWFDL